MKYLALILAFVLLPISTVAQQSGTKRAYAKDSRCTYTTLNVQECGKEIRELEAEEQEMIKEMEERAKEAKEKAEELERAADNLKKLHSGNLDQQINGLIDGARLLNSKRDSEDRPKDATSLSVVVTDKAIGFLGRMAQS